MKGDEEEKEGEEKSQKTSAEDCNELSASSLTVMERGLSVHFHTETQQSRPGQRQRRVFTAHWAGRLRLMAPQTRT